METQVRTPQMVFMQPQRLVVPLFQRPYVWNEEHDYVNAMAVDVEDDEPDDDGDEDEG